MRDAKVPGLRGGLVIFAGLFCLLPAARAQNPVLRDVEVRSFLGEPLNLRIALAASTVSNSGAICQSVIDDDQRENALRAADLMLTMVELRDSRYLQVRSRAAFDEPIARFSLRIGCPGEPIVDRQFTALLDPPPFTAMPGSSVVSAAPTIGASPSPAPVKSARAKPVVPASGTWTVREGDTVATLAKGIHPQNTARQRQYVAVLRELNPPIAGIGDDAPLTAGTQLALPDLLTLSGIMPRTAVAMPPASTPVSTDTPAAAPAAAKKMPATEKPVARAASPKVPKTDVAIAPEPANTAKTKVTPPTKPKTAAPVIKPVPSPRTAPRGESFQLRLSGSEMDLSRSRNVTDEQRQRLREKLMMLDSDDQVAALLSLRNTVTQLEQRLNEMQLKLAATPSMRPAAPSPTASVPTASPSTAPSKPQAPVPVVTAAPAPVPQPPSTPAALPAAVQTPNITPDKVPNMEAAAPQATPAPTAPESETKPVPAKSPLTTPPPQEAPLADTLMNTLSSPLVAGGIVAGLLALLAVWAWSRRGRQSTKRLDFGVPGAPRSDMTRAEATPAETTPAKSASLSPRDSGFSDWASQQVDNGPSTEPPASDVFMRTSRNLANEMDAAARGETDVARANAELARDAIAAEPVPDAIAIDAHSAVDAPVIFDDSTARFEVDARPATTVDFLVGMDEKLPEDRVRRLQYMHERYPELKSNTVSIDDADSVINAARLYYDEADKINGRDKASELLTFAVEERPQEIRFWLAQFEICRLENMVPEFTAMAGKFHVLFSHTSAWPKVRQIGNELDPGNPLFAAGGSPLLADETRFDPIAENWLNAPMDFTSDALMSDLRLALLDEHGVSRADFESITARLTASAEAA